MPTPQPQPLEPGDFYYTPEGYLVFTAQHHLRRGSCCGNGCRHCPWRKPPAGEPADDTET